MRLTTKLFTIVLACSIGLASGVARADVVGGGGFSVPSSGSEIDQRIAFIEDRLDAHRKHAYYWQWGWMGVYASGLVLGTARAIASDDNEHQADYVVTAIKGAGGVARMYLAPHPARNGADELRAMPANSRDAKMRKLAAAEQLLMDNAKATERRWSEKAHAANVLVNLAGAGIIWGLGSPSDALASALVGITVGTANILSAPWYGEDDLAEYRSRFGVAQSPKMSWKVVPTLGGAALQVTW